jgi:hypothetical protein
MQNLNIQLLMWAKQKKGSSKKQKQQQKVKPKIRKGGRAT